MDKARSLQHKRGDAVNRQFKKISAASERRRGWLMAALSLPLAALIGWRQLLVNGSLLFSAPFSRLIPRWESNHSSWRWNRSI